MASEDPAIPEPKVLLDRYRIEKTLGRGGMGEVLLAHDQLLNRRVALKRLDPTGKDRESRRRSVLKEARRASGISHPRIAAIYDVVDLPDEVMLVMEYVDGVTLRTRMAEPVPLDQFWDLASQCVEGIGAAHAHGVIHRDIKPENLMLTAGGQLKVLDFGIARQIAMADDTTIEASTDSRSYRIAGTPHYMSPEAHLGGEIGPRTDIFSLGVVFYELLTGRRPFEGDTYAVVVNQVLNSAPRPVDELNPAAGPTLAWLIDDMLAKEPALRVASAEEVGERLQRAKAEAGVSSIAGSAPARAGSPGRATPPRRTPAPTPSSARTLDMDAVAGARRLKPGAAIALTVASAALAVVVWRVAAAPALPRDVNLAVLGPVTPGASEDFAAFALGAMELTASRLRRHADAPDFQTASFSEGLGERVATSADARKVFGTNVALVSTLEQGPDRLKARLDLREPDRERVVASRTINVAADRPFEFLDALYRESAAMLRREARPGTAAEFVGVQGAGTLRFYLQGLGRRSGLSDSVQAMRAIEEFEAARRTEPNAAAPSAELALVERRLHQITGNSAWLDRADEDSRRAVALDSTSASAHQQRALVLTAQKHPDQALAEWERAVRIDSTDLDLAIGLARAYARVGRRDREKEIYLELIRHRPHAWQPYWSLATWQRRASELNESILSYERMIERAPLFYRGYANLGGALVLRGEYERAISNLRRSITLRPTATAFEYLGTAYFNTGRLREAVDAYNQSFQFGEAGYSTWLNLGDAYFWLRGERAQASEAYAKAVQLGRSEAAERALRGTTPDAELLSQLATVFPKLGLPDSARSYLARAMMVDSSSATVRFCAALTLWQLGERERALDALEHSVHAGYSVAWLRDSPIFREWRPLPRFRTLVGDTLGTSARAADTSRGGRS